MRFSVFHGGSLQPYLIGSKPVERLMLADGCLNTAKCEHRKISGQWPGVRQNQEDSAAVSVAEVAAQLAGSSQRRR
jgi:hypothetical protein